MPGKITRNPAILGRQLFKLVEDGIRELCGRKSATYWKRLYKRVPGFTCQFTYCSHRIKLYCYTCTYIIASATSLYLGMVNKKTGIFCSALPAAGRGGWYRPSDWWDCPIQAHLEAVQFWAMKAPSSAFTLGKVNNYALTLPLSVKKWFSFYENSLTTLGPCILILAPWCSH